MALTAATLRRNRIAILGYEFLWGVGQPFLHSATTLPGYLKALGAPGALIGLVPAVFSGGIALAGPFSLLFIRPGPHRFRKTMATYRIGIGLYLALAASAFWLPTDAVALRLACFFTCYTAYVLVVGTGDPHYVAMVVESIPDKERGWFFGLRLVWFAVGGLLGGLFAGPVLRAIPAPRNFGLSVGVGAILLLLSTLWFGRFRDHPAPAKDKRPGIFDCLLDVVRLAARRRGFLLFLIAACLLVAAQAPYAFIALEIKRRLGAGDALLGHLSAVAMASSLVFALAMGYAGDRFGHRRAFIAGLLLYAVGLVGSLGVASPFALMAAYFVASVTNPTWGVAAVNLGLECAREPDPARVYAGIALVTAGLRIIGPPLAGAAGDRWGCPPVFAAAALLCVLAALVALLLPQQKA